MLPAQNYINAMSIKLFEYMAVGLPCIASDFPIWKEIASETKAGMCVDVTDVKQIQEALKELLHNDAACEKMAINGRIAVEERFCWNVEEGKLHALYGGM